MKVVRRAFHFKTETSETSNLKATNKIEYLACCSPRISNDKTKKQRFIRPFVDVKVKLRNSDMLQKHRVNWQVS